MCINNKWKYENLKKYQWMKLAIVSHFLQEVIYAWYTFWTSQKIKNK